MDKQQQEQMLHKWKDQLKSHWWKWILLTLFVAVVVSVVIETGTYGPVITAVIAVLVYVFTKGFLDAGLNLRRVLAEALRDAPPGENRQIIWAEHFKKVREDIIVAAAQLPTWFFSVLKVLGITPSRVEIQQLIDDLANHEAFNRKYEGTDDVLDEDLEEHFNRRERITSILGHTGFFEGSRLIAKKGSDQ